MIKKIALSSFASVILLSQVANAEIKVAGGSLTATAGVMSQYLSRGIDQNKDRQTPYASIDFTRPLVGGVDFYLGVGLRQQVAIMVLVLHLLGKKITT